MGRHGLQTLAWMMIFVGGIVFIACLCSRIWFQVIMPLTSAGLVIAVVGLCLLAIGRRLN